MNRLLLRLIEASPLIVLVLAAAVWFSVPSGLHRMALDLGGLRAQAGMPGGMGYGREVAVLDQYANAIFGDVARTPVQVNEQLKFAGDNTTGAILGDPRRLYDEQRKLKPLAIPPDDKVFAALTEYEEASGGRVAVFTLPSRPAPSVIASAVVNEDVLRPEELRELETSGTLQTLRAKRLGSNRDRLTVDVESLDYTSSESDGDRVMSYGSVALWGSFYELYGLYPKSKSGEQSYPDASMFEISGPLSSETAGVLRGFAGRYNGALFLVGPIEAEPVPLRLPEGMTANEARRLLEVISPKRSAPGPSEPVAVPEGLRTRIGDWGMASVSEPSGSVVQTRETSATKGIDLEALRLPLVYVASYDVDPRLAALWEEVGRTPWHMAQVWMTQQSLVILGALAVMFVVSLVASPIAFGYERRRMEHIEIERQREHVQREARERVIGRLNELGERMESAAAATHGRTRRDVEDVADDIESTVSELKGILGQLERSEEHRRE